MRLSIFPLFALCAADIALASALPPKRSLGFTIPPDQPDGVYRAFFDDDGVEHHIRIDSDDRTTAPLDKTTATTNSSRELTSRQFTGSWRVFCSQPIVTLAAAATDLANTRLRAQCDSGILIGIGQFIYSRVEVSHLVSVLAYSCARELAGHCYSSLVAAADSAITDTCGLYRPGYAVGQSDIAYGYNQFVTNPSQGFTFSCPLY